MLEQMTQWAGKTAFKVHNWMGRVIGATRAQYATKVAWFTDRAWMEPYRKFLACDIHASSDDETRILDRRFQLLQFAKMVAKLPGSTAECGVYRGTSSGVICQALKEHYGPGDKHFGFDSFLGISKPGEHDRMADGSIAWVEGQLTAKQEQVAALLAEFSFCQLVRGWIPQSLLAATSHDFRLVHIDVDLYEPTLGSLEFFWPRMTRGGVIVFDDHGFADCPGARKAANEFFADKPEQVIDLATGQGFVIKQ